MDPLTALGAAGSVVGVADVAFKLASSFYKAYTEIAVTKVVLGSILDEVESMGTALKQISDLVSTEQRNVKQRLGFKLFTPVALCDVRKTAEKCLVVFWRIEGTILETAGTSGFEKRIATRRANFCRQARAGEVRAEEFGLDQGLADKATSFVKRARWQFKGTIPAVKKYCDDLHRYQGVFTLMLVIINIRNSQQQHDLNAFFVAWSQTSTVDQQRAILDVIADQSSGSQKKRVLSSAKRNDEEEKRQNDHLKVSSTLGNVPEHVAPIMTENGAAIRPGSTQAHSQQPKVEDDPQEVCLASSSHTGRPEEAPAQSSSDGKPATERQSQRILTEERVEGFGKSSIIEGSGTQMPEQSSSTNEIEDNDGEALGRRNDQFDKDVLLTASSKEPETPRPSTSQALSPGSGTLQRHHDPNIISKSAPLSIRNASPGSTVHYPGYTRKSSQNTAISTNDASSSDVVHDSDEIITDEIIINDETINDHRGSGEQSRLVFIVKEGSVQPAPRLSTRDFEKSLSSRLNLRSRRSLGYREFAFLNDPDRKAINSLLEETKPSKQASVQMEILKKSSLLGFGKAKSAVLIIIEEPGKSPKGGRPIDDRSSVSGSTAKPGSKSARDGEVSDEDYYQELTTYKTISIHPLPDFRRPKISFDKLGWENCARKEVTLDRADVLRRLMRIDKHGMSVADKRESLNSQQRVQVHTALVETARANMDQYNFEWTIRQLELVRKRVHLWSFTPVTIAVVVYLQRSPRPHADLKFLFSLEKRQINMGWGAQPRPFPGPPPPPPMMSGAGPRPMGMMPVPPPPPMQQQMPTTNTTYTRIARRHLSLECLKVRGIDYELDVDPDYVIIKRWVPPEEQKELWALTKVIRDGREKVTTTLAIEDRSHHHHRHKSGDNLVVVKKTKRERSRSPSVSTLMYLAGAGISPPARLASGQSPSSTSQQPSRATGMPKDTLPGVDKEIVDMLLRRWTPGAAEVSDGSEEWISEDEEGEEP